MVVWGALQAVATVFNAADASMGLMATINLVTIVALSGTVVKLTRDYFAQRAAGLEPVFHGADYPELGDRIEHSIWYRDEPKAEPRRVGLGAPSMLDGPGHDAPGRVPMPSVAALAATAAIAAGAACVAAALWMLVSRSGRPAVAPLALVAGVVLLALPGRCRCSHARRTGRRARARGDTVGAVSISADGTRTVAAEPPKPVIAPPPAMPGRPAVKIDIEASEAEPNDTLAAANVAQLGTAIVGELGEGDLDFFAFGMPPGLRGEVVAALTVLEGNAGLTMYDDTGEAIGSMDTPEQISVRTAMLARMIDAPAYYVMVRANPDRPGPAKYHRRWRSAGADYSATATGVSAPKRSGAPASPRAARKRSASSAAMQPMPAEVTAWR